MEQAEKVGMLGSNWDRLSIPDKMDYFMNYFTKITKEESYYIDYVLSWDDETKAAFRMAKRVFEEKDERKSKRSSCLKNLRK